MLGQPRAGGAAAQETVLSLPFTGLWLAQNSPARRVPSQGTDLFGGRYAIDFLAVDDRRRTAGVRDWRTVLATEPAERFYAFGQPVLAPGSGTVVDAHDAQPDHGGRRSQIALVGYMAGQAGRLRQGAHALAGNHVTIRLHETGTFVALAHLQRASVQVRVGQDVVAGEQIARCGNSGNSTEPHVHLQVMDSADPSVAQGLPMVFEHFREQPRGTRSFQTRRRGLPGEGSVVERLGAPLDSDDA